LLGLKKIALTTPFAIAEVNQIFIMKINEVVIV